MARAEPDGYTLGSGGMSAHVLAAALSDNPGFDPIRDFSHIAFLGGGPSLIVVHPSTGVKSLKEMLAYVRAQNEQVPYVSAGTGTVGHMVFAYVVTSEKLNAVHIPYRAGSGAVIDLLAGRVKVGALNWTTARQHVQSGALVALGVSSERRMPQLPNLPTLRELGYPDVVTTTWTMLTAPAGVPKTIVGCCQSRGAAHLGQAGVEEAFRERGRGAAADVGGGTDRFCEDRGCALGAVGAHDGEAEVGCPPTAASPSRAAPRCGRRAPP